jgi:dienelactone hydrolase
MTGANSTDWPRGGFFQDALISRLSDARQTMLDLLRRSSPEECRSLIRQCHSKVIKYFQAVQGVKPEIRGFNLTSSHECSPGEILNYDVYLTNGSRISLVIAMPRNPIAPRKTVIGLHGTHESREYYLGTLKDSPRRGHENSLNFLLPLFEAGYVVVCPDLPSFGNGYPGRISDNADEFTGYIEKVDVLARLIGRCYAAEAAGEIMAVVDFLELLPNISTSHIGITGFSLGGQIASVTAACDTRIGAVIDGAGLFTYERFFGIWPQRITEITYIFGDCLGDIGDLWNIALGISPRPQLRLACKDDFFVPLQAVYDIMEMLDLVYKAFGCAGKARISEYAGEHDIQPKMACDIVDWLGVNL